VTYVAVPDPVFVEESIRITGRADALWVDKYLSTVITFRVNKVYDTAPAVSFNNRAATSVTAVAYGDPTDERTQQIEVTCTVPPTSDICATSCNYPVKVVANGKTVTSTTTIEFRDTTVPFVSSIGPSWARPSGGGIKLLGLTGFCKGFTNCPTAFTARFGATDLTVLGAVTLSSWQAKDASYDALVGGDALSAFLVGSGDGAFKTIFSQVVSLVEAQVAASNGRTLASRSHIMAVVIPSGIVAEDFACDDPNAALCSTAQTLTITASGNTADTTVDFYKDVATAATVQSVSPSSSFLQGNQLITVQLSSFSTVYSPSEVTIKVGTETVPQASVKVTGSNPTGFTQVTFYNPSAPEGVRTISVSPTRQPGNIGTSKFTYIDDRVPALAKPDPSPNKMYSDGGTTVTCTFSLFGDASITAANVAVSARLGSASSVTVASSSVTVSYDAVSSLTTVSFPSPSIAVTGTQSVTVSVQYVPTLKSVSFPLSFVAKPTTAATMSVIASTTGGATGDSTGLYAATLFLTNFQTVAASSELSVTWGTTTIASTAITLISSTVDATYVTVTVPYSATGGGVAVTCQASARPSNAGTATFTYVDVNQAELDGNLVPAQGDSGSDTTVRVSIKNIGAIYSIPSQLTVTPTAGLTSLAISISSIVYSDLTMLQLTLLMPKNQVAEATTVTFTIGPAATNALKTVTASFTYQPVGAPRIDFFTPTTYFTDGGPNMQVQAVNFLTAAPKEPIYVQFGSSTVNVTHADITFANPSDSFTGASFNITIPQAAATGSVTPVLIRDGVSTAFPYTFVYTTPPDVAISAVFPLSGFTSTPSTVTLTLDNFPAVTKKADGTYVRSEIVVVFGTNKVTGLAEITSDPTQVEPSLDPTRLQSIRVTVQPPCCSDSVIPGKTQIQVWHKNFPLRFAVTEEKNYFEYINPDNPRVQSVVGNNGAAEAKMSASTLVTLKVSNTPLGTTVADISVFVVLQGTSASVACSVEQLYAEDADGIRNVLVLVPGSTTAGAAEGTVVFFSGNAARQSSATFSITYKNDALPVVTAISPSAGEHFGGRSVRIEISNFPQVTATDQVTVTFGSSGAITGTVTNIISSDPPSTATGSDVEPPKTELLVTTPFYPGIAAGAKTEVAVTVTPLSATDKAATGKTFQLEHKLAKLRTSSGNFGPLRGPTTGGTFLSATIDYFPGGTTAGGVGVEFGDVIVPASDITVLESTNFATQLKVKVPAQTAAGTVKLYIYSVSLSKANPPIGVPVDFVYFDILRPALSESFVQPSLGCINRAPSAQKETIYIEKMPAGANAGNVTVQFGTNAAKAVDSVTYVDATTAAIVVGVDSIAAAGTVAVVVTYGADQVSLSYELYDCDVPFLISYQPSPAKGVYTGGAKVNLLVSKFASYALSTLTVTFGTVAGTVESTTAAADGTTATVIVVAPAVLVFDVITATLKTTAAAYEVSFPFTVVEPCDYSEHCATFGYIQNPVLIAADKPVDDTCEDSYCLDPNTFPVPSVKSFLPSTGYTQGGTTVTVLIANFPATSLSDVLVSVGEKTATPISLTDKGGTPAISELVFDMPASPINAGEIDVVMKADFAGISAFRKTSAKFRYFLPVIGPAVVTQASPTEIFPNAVPAQLSIYVMITNFEALDDLTDTSQVKVKVGGVGPISVTSIQQSNSDFTVVYTALPNGVINSAGNQNITVSIYGPSESKAGTFVVYVKPVPVPLFSSIFPTKGLASELTSIKVFAKHMDPLTSTFDTTATIQGASGGSAAVTVVNVPQQVGCTTIYCDLHQFDLTLPLNPDGVLFGGLATITISGRGRTVTVPFTYLASNTPNVKLVDPSTGSSLAGTVSTITVENFPAVATKDQIQASVDSVGAVTVNSFALLSSQLQVGVSVPASSKAGTFGGRIYRSDLADAYGSWDFLYVQPEPTFSPIDGTTDGGTVVTITAFWGSGAGTATDMAVTFDGKAGTVNSAISNGDTGSIVTVTTPAADAKGAVVCVLTGKSGFSTTFKFEYFTPPTVASIQPPFAKVDGSVADCAECLSDNDKETISVWIDNFPEMTDVASVQVRIGSITCGATPASSCYVKSFASLVKTGDAAGSKQAYLTVKVPPQTSGQAGGADVQVTFTGKAAAREGHLPLPDGDLRARDQERHGQVGVDHLLRLLPPRAHGRLCRVVPRLQHGHDVHGGVPVRQRGGGHEARRRRRRGAQGGRGDADHHRQRLHPGDADERGGGDGGQH